MRDDVINNGCRGQPPHAIALGAERIQIEEPCHLLDVPRVKTFINTYRAADIVLQTLMDKRMGRSVFNGKSLGDAFCGKWDTHL